MDRGAWPATVHGVAKSQTWLSDYHSLGGLSYVQLFATLWTVAHQAPLSIEFFRQEYWCGLPFPPPEDLPELRFKTASLMSPALADRLSLCSVQSLSHVPFLVTPWTAACQASLSVTNSQSLLKLMFMKSAMPYNRLILCCPLLLPPSNFHNIRVFPMSQFFTSGCQNIGASASTSVLPMNIQDWFLLGLTGWISLKFKGLSRVFSNTTVQKCQFFRVQLL